MFSKVSGMMLGFLLLPRLLDETWLVNYLNTAITVTEFEVLLRAVSNELLKL